jgi:ankyrin repeat protein
MKKTNTYRQLMAAIKSKSVKDCKTLIDSKANVNYILENKATAFQYACQEGNPEIIKLLIDSRADVNLVTGAGSPLIMAIHSNNLKILPLLIHHRANVDISFKGTTPLFEACQKQLNTAVMFLLAANPKPDLSKTYASMKITVLHLACFLGNLKIVQTLIRAKADLNVEDGDKLTPLRTAFRMGRQEIVSYLIEQKADVNYRDEKKNTVLHYAVTETDVSIVRLLINAQADIDTVGYCWMTPLDLAKNNKIQPMIELLESLKAMTTITVSDEKMKLYEQSQNLQAKLAKSAENIMKSSPIDQPQFVNMGEETEEELKTLSFESILNLLSGATSLPDDFPQPTSVKSDSSLKGELFNLDQKINNLNSEIVNKRYEPILRATEEKRQATRKDKHLQTLTKTAQDLQDSYQLAQKEFSTICSEYKKLTLPEHLRTQQQKIAALQITFPDKIAVDSSEIISRLQTQTEMYKNDLHTFKENMIRLDKKHKKNQAKKTAAKQKKLKKTQQEIKTIPIKTVRVSQPVKKINKVLPIKTKTSVLARIPPTPQNYHWKQKHNIAKNIRASKFLFNKLRTTSIETFSFQELTALKFSLIQLLLNIFINQNQITHHPRLRNLRHTLHRMSIVGAETNPYSFTSTQLHEQIHELANALKEFTGLYKWNVLTDEFYLPRNALLHFTSPLLTRMAGTYLDTREIADEKFQDILRQSAGQAKYYWMQLINILSQPAMPNPQELIVSVQQRRLAITFATLCQIAEASEAKHSTIRAGIDNPIMLSRSLVTIASEWRHRGLSLEEAGDRLEHSIKF